MSRAQPVTDGLPDERKAEADVLKERITSVYAVIYVEYVLIRHSSTTPSDVYENFRRHGGLSFRSGSL